MAAIDSNEKSSCAVERRRPCLRVNFHFLHLSPFPPELVGIPSRHRFWRETKRRQNALYIERSIIIHSLIWRYSPTKDEEWGFDTCAAASGSEFLFWGC
jgi:hypothetical protein